MANEIIKFENLQTEFEVVAKKHLQIRAANNPEFQEKFIKTFSDLVFSQSDEMLEKLNNTRQNSLLNAIFMATELGASFAKKEISFIPYEIFKKESKNGVEKKVATGVYDAIVIVDIKFQKQQILKLKNCSTFFTAEVHEGVQVINDLTTGNFVFVGTNDVTKKTVGYYARFVDTDLMVYDIFMSCAEIIDRAKYSPQFKESNYKQYGNNPHMEKVVVRNLMKIIPKISEELSSIIGIETYDREIEITEHEDVTNKQLVNALEEAKKEISPSLKKEKQVKQPIEVVDVASDQQADSTEKKLPVQEYF